MARRLFGMAALGTTIIAISACDGRIPFSGQTNNNNVTASAPADVNIGSPLYEPTAAPVAPKVATKGTQADPIVIQNAQITVPRTENVPSKNNGTLWQICTELTPGQNVPKDDIFEHPIDPNKKYRRLKEGENVVRGQLVALLDDRVAQAKHQAALVKNKAYKEILEKSTMASQSQEKSLKVLETPGIASKLEVEKARTEYMNALKQQADAQGNYDQSFEEIRASKVQLEEHELRAAIDGRIKTRYRNPGESVKELEPVLMIENLGTLRVEGGMPIQYLPYLTNAHGKEVWLEPSAQLGPLQELIGHWSAVTGVAVSKNAQKPLIVTVSEDKTLRVWDQKSRSQIATYSLDTPIRAVACTGPKSQLNLALFGADDGYGYLYNLDASGNDAVKKFKAKHKGRVVAVAFSPDGQNCATADDKEIIIWDTEKLEPRYRFSAEHRGPITSLQFTPQTKLVSVARDRTVRVWDLGDKGAKLNNVLDNRSGNVDVLGVSPDGQRILFDQERSLHVRNLNDQRTEAILPAPTDSTQFTGFAVFSHDGKLAITAGTADNPLGVWKLPDTGNRAYQRVRLAAGGSIPTCAAVAPEGGFVVIGTQDHRVLLYAKPEKTDLEKQYRAFITNLELSLDSTEKKLRLWAELDNPGMPLIPGDTIQIVVPIQ